VNEPSLIKSLDYVVYARPLSFVNAACNQSSLGFSTETRECNTYNSRLEYLSHFLSVYEFFISLSAFCVTPAIAFPSALAI
jgi:hypothetical protein